MKGIQLPGIVDARARSVAVTSPRLQQVATQLTRTSRPKRDQACGWNRVVLASLQRRPAEVIQRVPFRVEITSDEHGA